MIEGGGLAAAFFFLRGWLSPMNLSSGKALKGWPQAWVGVFARASRARRYSAPCCRYLWTKAIAMLPSPTAEATRLTGLNRTSPHAKTPGTLVSRR